MKLNELFEVRYGSGLSLNHLTKIESGINFVSRTTKNNGVSSKIKKIDEIKPMPAGTISIALSGNGVLTSFIQPFEYYTGFHVAYLIPRKEMTLQEKLFYCVCIKSNRYKYSYGRQANKTLEELDLPPMSEIPEWVNNVKLLKEPTNDSFLQKESQLNLNNWEYFKLGDLFKIEKGRETSGNHTYGSIPLISATIENNGVKQRVSGGNKIFQENTITVPSNGASTGEAFYQSTNYCATGDVNILIPMFKLNKYIALFINAIIRLEKYRFSYGRKWGKTRMEDSKIKLPANKKETPNFEYMENYIKSLKYSEAI